MTDGLTFATVVFDAEVDLLDLQARSMARHLDPGVVDAVLVIDNSVFGFTPGRVRRLRAAYGRLGPRLSLVRTRELVRGQGVDGWRSQQAAKLLIAERIASAHYVVLDAKNHLIGPADRATFVGADGRAHGGLHSYRGHPLRGDLERTLRYLDAPAETVEAALDSFPPTATPMVLHTATVRAMIDDVRLRSDARFEVEFERARLLEFFLYSSWTALRGPGIDAVLDGRTISTPVVWPKATSVGAVRAVVAEAARTDARLVGVHRRVLVRADPAARAAVADWWVSTGLVPDLRAARRVIARARLRYWPAMMLTRGSERVGRLRSRIGAPADRRT